MLLTVKQAAEKLRISPSLVYALAREGRLRHMRIGQQGKRGRLLFKEKDLDAFMEACSREPPEDPGEDAYRRHMRN